MHQRQVDGGAESMSASDVDAAHAGLGAALRWEAAWRPPGRHTAAEVLIEWSLGVYRVDTAVLRRLAPDVILTQVQAPRADAEPNGSTGAAAGSSPRFPEVEAALAELLGTPPPLVVHLEPQGLADALADMRRIGDALRQSERGEALAASTGGRIEAVADAARGRGPPRNITVIQWARRFLSSSVCSGVLVSADPDPDELLLALCSLTQADPLYAAGAWVPELIGKAGARDVCAKPGGPAVLLADEGMRQLAAAADAVLVSICGKGPESALDDARAVRAALARASVGRPPPPVVVFDGRRLFSRAGPTLADSVEALAESLHSEMQLFGHNSAGRWRALEPEERV